MGIKKRFHCIYLDFSIDEIGWAAAGVLKEADLN